MQVPIRLTVHGPPLAEHMKGRILERFSRLDEYYDRITGCRIAVQVANLRRHHGRLYKVRVDISVPRGVLAIDRQRGPTLWVTLREAFDAARRRVQDYARVARGQVKARERTGRESWMAGGRLE